MHAVEVRPGDRQAARGRAGGEQQRAVGEGLTDVGVNELPGGIDAGDSGVPQQFDVILGVPALRIYKYRVTISGSAEVILRQRGADVGPMRFGADEPDPPGEVFFPQCSRSGCPSEPRSDDDETLGIRHDFLPLAALLIFVIRQ